MGSRSNNKYDLAYIAGFLDGDGSLMFQIKKRKDGKMGWRFMFTICFYQDSRHEKPLFWIRQKLGIGYISHRNDHMTELRINGYIQTKRLLELLIEFIRFKKKQAQVMLRAATILCQNDVRHLCARDKRVLAACVLKIQEENYVTRNKKTREEVMMLLGLTP